MCCGRSRSHTKPHSASLNIVYLQTHTSTHSAGTVTRERECSELKLGSYSRCGERALGSYCTHYPFMYGTARATAKDLAKNVSYSREVFPARFHISYVEASPA